jgi:hypothetical protein
MRIGGRGLGRVVVAAAILAELLDALVALAVRVGLPVAGGPKTTLRWWTPIDVAR